MQESHTEGMVSKEWIQATRTYFLDFLHTTGFPELQRHGERGLLCAYPEWLIMLTRLLCFAIAGVNVILLGPIPASG
jgi:hypothetical protein